MPVAVLGTAHLFGTASVDVSEALLAEAWDVGYRAFDTAPSYGHGRTEAALGERLRQWPSRPQLTSKVGLEPGPGASAGVRAVKAVARRLPVAAQRRLRRGDGVPHGVFDPDLVRHSLGRTLERLGPLDRLMLHEAHAGEVGDAALEVLAAARDRGDVGQIGVATVNAAAGDVARRAPDLVHAAHLEVGPFAAPADLPAQVTTVVGHGVLGPAASGLRRLDAWTREAHESATHWREVSAGTRWAGTAGLADALVARAAALPVTDVIVATTRTDRLANLFALASGIEQMPDDVATALGRMVDAARA